MLVYVLIAIWISVKGLGTVAHNGESEKWVTGMLFFTSVLPLAPLLKLPSFTGPLQATSGSCELKGFRTQDVSLTVGSGEVSRQLLTSNCLSVI